MFQVGAVPDMDAFYGLVDPFVGHPARAALGALGWLIAGALVFAASMWWPTLRVWPLFVAGGSWGFFALLEAQATREKANIRADLLFTWPLLCLITLGCAVTWIVLLFRRRGPTA